MKTLRDAKFGPGTKILVRYDLDVPLKDGVIQETFRLDAGLSTLEYILKHNGFPIIMGHIGRPKGQILPELSTKHLKPYFDEKLGKENYELLENLRFDEREKENDPSFSKELADKALIYINECFSTSHREHVSIVGVPKFIPAYAGFRLEQEVQTLNQLFENPERPFVAILGGAKLETKMPVVSKFLQTADKVLLGGRLGLEWKELIPENLHLPTDYAQEEKDIGPDTINEFKRLLFDAKTILWAGPMGVYEEEKFAVGSNEIARELVGLKSSKGTFVVIGGGDTIAAAEKVINVYSLGFVSTGGGAMLKYIADGTLPGLKALEFSVKA